MRAFQLLDYSDARMKRMPTVAFAPMLWRNQRERCGGAEASEARETKDELQEWMGGLFSLRLKRNRYTW